MQTRYWSFNAKVCWQGKVNVPTATSVEVKNITIITRLLLCYLDLGLVCTIIYQLDDYTPVKCFNKFVQSVVDTRWQGDENPISSVVAETVKLLTNNSYDYQIIDRSRHSVTKYLPEWWEDVRSNQQYSVQETSSYRWSTLRSGTGEVRNWT